MCGKFTQMMTWAALHEFADFLNAPVDGATEFTTPMRPAFVITLDQSGKRASVPMRWGFADSRAAMPLGPPKHIHARAETIDQLPTFREAFAHARGLVVVDTFNIGQDVTPKKTIQHVLSPKDKHPLALAVIWERWVSRDEGELLTFAMIAVPANALIAAVTDRMPAIVAPEDWGKWLGEEPATVAELKALLKPSDVALDMALATKAPPPPKPRRNDAQAELF